MSKAIAKQAEQRPARRWEGSPFGALRDEMEQMFANFFGSGAVKTEGPSFPSPRLDMAETDAAVEVDTDLPGYKPDEVHVEILDNRLIISGEHSEERKEDGKDRKYHRVERRSGSFSRSVWLPCGVDEGQIDAQLKDGVLHIRLPKSETAKSRKITVKG